MNQVTSASTRGTDARSSTGFLTGLGLAASNSGTASPAQDAPTALAQKQCQNLLKRRLNRPLLALFRQLTGLRLHVWWHEPAVQLSQHALVQLCPQARRTRAAGLGPTCQECLRKRWLPQWTLFHLEQRFSGLCGLSQYCACLKLQGHPVVTLLVQQPPPTSRVAKQAFSRALSLTRLIRHDLHVTLQARQAVAELESLRTPLAAAASSREAAVSGKPEAARSRARRTKSMIQNSQVRGPQPRTDRGLLRSPPIASPRRLSSGRGASRTEPHRHLLNGNHREQLVQRMLDYVHQHYAHPIVLADLAAVMNLNPSYVSFLFSATLGVTFHRYMERFRLARAKDLLRDPVQRISEVAYAVGYTSPNHFRNVFTARVGVPPSAWREAQTA